MQSENSINHIDVNSSDFQDKLLDEIANDLTRLKKNITIITKIRMTGSEMEVETAAMHHALLWHQLKEAKDNIVQSENSQQ
ncbi:unnamed protein product [Pieris macdunnoughi]|uniref:Uncharacterized protein n=1 Tax=Pieris macdunnoughi TaxID=345717 RepID=A0A821VU42_9NEOP|nr:unnamed protein product [Pieris macdunnoughi]